ncbi:hypothetical protein [Rhizobium sp. Root482]|jgi:hypothetical protein|nr:hypothetical protein [Rhizobium sp. Root482]
MPDGIMRPGSWIFLSFLPDRGIVLEGISGFGGVHERNCETAP